jgi:DNA repair protein RadC
MTHRGQDGRHRSSEVAEAGSAPPAHTAVRTLLRLPTAERPRERLERVGPAALATAELLGIVLGTGRPGASAVDLATELMAGRGLVGLARSTTGELCSVSGCGPAKAVRLLAALELGRRVGVEARGDCPQVNTPAEAAELLQAEMGLLEQEHLRVVLLSMKNHVLGVHEVYKGSVNASLVRVSEVFREAVRRNCPAIIVVHNHPSGDPAPSAEDIHITHQMVQAGRILDIELLDHIIIGRQRWVSLRERGLGFG